MSSLNQIYATGSVAGFAGGSGLLTTILGLISGTEVTDEVIDSTPNGVLTSFSGTLAQTPCGLGRLIVTYTIGAVDYEATDNGSGVLTGTGATGTIVYSTGAWTLVTTSPLDNLTNVTADYLYGERGADWRVKMNQTTTDDVAANPFGAGWNEVILHNTGLSGQENVLVGVREWKYVAGGAYGWDLNGYTAYNAGQTWNASGAQHGLTSYSATWEHWDQLPMLPCIDATMYYWLYSNSQRIVLVVKVSSQYESIYLGFGRRFGLPSDYPYPLIIKGSAYGDVLASDVTERRTYIAHNVWTANGYPLLAVSPGNSFIVSGGASYAQGVKVEPRAIFDAAAGTLGLTKTSGRVMRTPVYMTQPAQSRCLMDLDGVSHLAGQAILSEDTVIADGKKHRIFQNIFNTTYYDFLSVVEATTTSTSTSTSSSSSSTSTSTSTSSSTSTSTSTSSSTSSSSSSSSTSTSTSTSSSTTTTVP